MSELHQVAALVGLVVPAVLGVAYRWLNPSDEARYALAVLVSSGVGVGLLALLGAAIDPASVTEATMWVWGVSQLAFKGQQAAVHLKRRATRR